MSDPTQPISDDEIASRARQLWEAEGKPEGKADEHWSRAETELRVHLLAEVAAVKAFPVIPAMAGIS